MDTTVLSETTGSVKKAKTHNQFYFSSDKGLYRFSLKNFNRLDTRYGIYNSSKGTHPLNTVNTSVKNFEFIDHRHYNSLFDYKCDELILTGNGNLLKSYDYGKEYLDDIIDSNFYDRNKSKMLFMNYDIASKLNFFRDNGEYRLPEPITFDITSTISNINFLSNIEESNWIDYWKDSLQTFKYNTISGLDESTKVLFSTDFTLKENASYKKQILSGDISVDNIDILNLAPEIDNDSNRFYGTSTIIAPTSTKELFLYKYLMIVKVSDIYPIDVSDVIEISCKGDDGNIIIEANLIVNRIETFSSDNYIYMYTEFNDNIIKSIKENGCDLTNLNKFENYDDLENKFNTHPISNAYSLELSGYYDYIDPVITTQLDEPTSPNDGYRYLIGFSSSDIPTSSITPATNWTSITGGSIVEWNGSLSKWDSYIPEEGTSVISENRYIISSNYISYNYQNNQWIEVPFEGNATIKAKFNNKTAYYNLGTTIDTFDNSGSGLLNQATDSGLKQTAMDYTNVADSIIPGDDDTKVRATSIIHSESTTTWSSYIGTIDDNAVYDPSIGIVGLGNSLTDIDFYIFIFRGDVSDLSTTDPSGEVVVNNDNIYLGDGTLTNNSGTRELTYYDGTSVTMNQSDSTTYTLSNFATDIEDDFESRNPGIGITVNPIAIAIASTTNKIVKLEIYFEIFYLTDETTVINDVNQIDTITLNAIDYYSWEPQGPLNFDFRDSTTNTRTELDGTTPLIWEPIGTPTTTYTLGGRLLLQWIVYSKVNCTFYMYNGGGGHLHELNSETGSFTFNHELINSFDAGNHAKAYYNDYNDYIYQLTDRYNNVTYTPFNPITNSLLTPIVLGNNGGSGNYVDSDITQDGKIVTLFSDHIKTIDTTNANNTNILILSTSYNTIKLFEDKIILKSDGEISLYDNQLNLIWTTTLTTPITNNNMDIDTSSNQIIITFYNSGLGSIILINIIDGSTTIISTGLSSIGNRVKYIKELDATYIYGDTVASSTNGIPIVSVLKNGVFKNNVFIHNISSHPPGVSSVHDIIYTSGTTFLSEIGEVVDMSYNDKNKTMYLISPNTGYFLPCQIKNDELYLMQNDIKIIGGSSGEIILSECGDGSMWTFAYDTQFGAGKMEINKFEVSNNITDPSIIKTGYTGCFVDFGYSPIYNIYDYLNNINSVLFTPDKEYLAMPIYKNIPLGSLTPSVGYIDTGIRNNNKILLGTDLKFEWESVFIDTFVDVDIVAQSNTYSTEKLLVMDKYYDEPNDAYVIEFHKKIEFDGSDTNILNGNGSLNIISRRKLSQISDDLRILNNIHRSKKSKKITPGSEYFVYDNELTTKIKTNSYTNILLSDQNTKDNLTAVIYTDDTNELSMNILNLDEEINPIVNGIVESNGKVSIIFKDKHNLSEHDLISISYSGDSVLTADNGCFPNSSAYDPNFFGSHVISISSPNSITLDIPWNPLYSLNKFTVSFTKTDSFLDYTPIDLVDIGVDKKGKTAIELLPENSLFKDNKYELVNVDFNKFRYRLFDGLTINDLIVRYPWILEAEISNAAIGLVNDELTWYSGIWECGRWFEGNWMSGQWMSGDFYGGTWNAKKVIDKKINIEIADKKTIDDESIWHGGRWFDGTWNGGVWRTGRWYAGDFNSGKWLDGIWNDGTFNNGNWNGGIWVLGTWNNGVFNTDNKPSYWIDGKFNGGDFGNGIWYNGTFESKNTTARFGTESFNSRPSIWHGGDFISGSFHSFLDKDDNDNIVRSKIHKYSVWNTGNFISGDFYGGVAYNINFNGTWHGGILEDIQIIGMDNIIDPLTNIVTGKTLTLNGIFRFNIGNEITIMSEDLNTYKTKVRLPVEEDVDSFTTKVETIPDVDIPAPIPYKLISYGLLGEKIINDKYKIVSEFNNTNWKSGIWTNGVFNSGLWEGGMFYDGIFNGVSI